jgi:hypothetical protein
MPKKKLTVEQEVRNLFRENYRLASSGWVGGENRITVVIGEKPTATAESERVWHKKHTWSGTNLYVRITISPVWRRSVRARGLAVLDGLLTTHSGHVRRHAEIEAYNATWIRQGQGLSIRPESGWIAYHRPSGTSYHLPGGDAAVAVAALRRKLRRQAIPQEQKDERRRLRHEARRARLERLTERLAHHDISDVAEVVVTREDSLRAGNCEPGTDEFIDRFFSDQTSATIAQIAVAVGHTDISTLGERDLTLARQIAAACLMAIRRDRSSRRNQA